MEFMRAFLETWVSQNIETAPDIERIVTGNECAFIATRKRCISEYALTVVLSGNVKQVACVRRKMLFTIFN